MKLGVPEAAPAPQCLVYAVACAICGQYPMTSKFTCSVCDDAHLCSGCFALHDPIPTACTVIVKETHLMTKFLSCHHVHKHQLKI